LSAWFCAIWCAKLTAVMRCWEKPNQSLRDSAWLTRKPNKSFVSFIVVVITYSFVGWQLGNCECYTDVNGNIKVRKNEADKAAKVDGIISMIIAAHCSLDNPFVSDSFGFRSF